jgi:hypothetical protein
VCVVPATGTAASSDVNVFTVADGKIVTRDTIDATGKSIARSKDDCNGVESANWSADGRRLYVSSDFTCPGGLKRTSSGLFAMSPRGEWVNVQGVDAAGNKGVQTVRYSDAGNPATLPGEISQALGDRGIAVSTARAAAGARLTTANVVEASHVLDPIVVEAWIVDRGQSFGVDAGQIVALADAGVPGNVTDAMVAVSYPKAFAVNPSDQQDMANGGAAEDMTGSDIQRAAPASVDVMMVPTYSRYNYSPFGYMPYDYGYGYGYSPYGYSPYASPYAGYYSPYPRYGGLYNGAYGGWYAPPVIVLRGDQHPQPRGRVVNGHGYTRTPPRRGGAPSSSGGSTASPRPTLSPPSDQTTHQSPPASSGHTAHIRP